MEDITILYQANWGDESGSDKLAVANWPRVEKFGAKVATHVMRLCVKKLAPNL